MGAWVLNGFIAQNEEEAKKLADLKAELGFDPCEESHKLRAVRGVTPKEQARDIKRVLESLTQDQYHREEKSSYPGRVGVSPAAARMAALPGFRSRRKRI